MGWRVKKMGKVKAKASDSLAGGCLSLFGLPFLIGGIFLSGIYFRGYSQWWQARSWEEVPCWIESTKLESHQGDDSTTYKAVATYRYEFKGHLYHGDRVTLVEGADNVGEFQQKTHRELARYVVGKAKGLEDLGSEGKRKPFRCYVNPDKPDEAVLYRGLRWQIQAFMAAFALTFPAVGAGLVVGGFLAVRAARKDLALVAKHPEQPWFWKSEWVQSSIPESLGGWRKGLHFYTIWAGLVIFPLITFTAMSGAFKADENASFLFGFVILWCVPAWFSLRRFRQYLAVGSPGFEMTQIPAEPGGVLEGDILLGRPPSFRGDAELGLMCIRQLTRKTSDGDSTATEKIWSHTQNVRMDQITHDVSGFRLPVSIALPPDAPQSGAADDPAIAHTWSLRLKLPGTLIGPMFDVPVFRTGNSSAATMKPPVGIASIRDFASADLPALLAARHLRVDFDGHGFPSSIVCPAARHRGLIGFLIVFNLIWTAAAVFLIQSDAPLVIRIIWPVSATVIWWIVLYQMLHSRHVSFDTTGLEILNHVGPWVRVVKVEKSQIVGFSHDTNMSSNNKNFYRVRMEDVFGKKRTLVDGITESTTAAALAERLGDWRKSR